MNGFDISDLRIISTPGVQKVIGIQLGSSTANDNSGQMSYVHRVFCDTIDTCIKVYGENNEIRIEGNWIYYSTTGINMLPTVGSNSGISIRDNQFQTVYATACLINGTSKVTYDGNIIQGSQQAMSGLVVNNADNVSFTNNYFESGSGVGGFAVWLGTSAYGSGGMSGAIISGNHIDYAAANPGQSAVKIDYSSGTTITSNSFLHVNTAILITANAYNTFIGPEVYYGVTTNVSNSGTNIIVADGGDMTIGHGTSTGIAPGSNMVYIVNGNGIRVSSSTTGNDAEILMNGASGKLYITDWNTGTKGIIFNTTTGAVGLIGGGAPTTGDVLCLTASGLFGHCTTINTTTGACTCTSP